MWMNPCLNNGSLQVYKNVINFYRLFVCSKRKYICYRFHPMSNNEGKVKERVQKVASERRENPDNKGIYGFSTSVNTKIHRYHLLTF